MIDSIIATFHLDWKLMVAQVVNFGIVAAVLWFLALKPLNKKMQERTKIIEQGLRNAKESVSKIQEAEERQAVIIKEARQEAQKILSAMESNAATEKARILAQAKAEAGKVILEAKKQLESEKVQMVQQAKKEVADLVVLATQKVLEKTVSEKVDRALIEQSLEEAESALREEKTD